MKHGIGIVKGLWGDETLRRRTLRPPDAFEEVKKGVLLHKENGGMVDAVFCFGGRNKVFLRDLGYQPIKLSDKAWASPQRPGKRLNPRFSWAGVTRVGYSYWWHKLKIIEAAFQHFPNGVLWTDFDVIQTKQQEIEWLYDDLASGQPLRASLYVQHNWTWGAGWRHNADWNVPRTEVCDGDTHAAARIVLGCGFLFVRSKDLIQEALEIQDEFPHFLDQQVITLLFDRMHGGKWIGQDAYMDQGWHTKGYYYARQLYPPRRSQVAFQSGKREKRIYL